MLSLRNILRQKQGYYYDNCTELPLYNFVKIIITQDLAKYGVRNSEVWDKIWQEYVELLKDDKSISSMLLERDINYLTNKIYIIEVSLQALAGSNRTRAAALLQKEGYRYQFSETSWHADAKRVQSQYKSLKTQRAELLKRYDDKPKENSFSESSFDNNLIVLGKHFGWKIDSKTTSVSEYCAMNNQFKEEIKNATNRFN